LEMPKHTTHPGTTALDVANYLIKRAGKERKWVDPMQLQKLVFFAQCWYLAEHGRCLFGEPVEAWTWGPAVRNVWKAYSGARKIVDDDVFFDELDDDAVDVIESVWCAYGHLSGPALSRLTHRDGGAWHKTRKGLPDRAKSERTISETAMRLEVSAEISKKNKWLGDNWNRVMELAGAAS
jgi:uncharacterized phage-associated protein